MTRMTIDEVTATIKAATEDAVSKMTSSLSPNEIAEYVLRHYAGLDWSKVTALQAELTADVVLHIDFAYAAPVEYITIDLSKAGREPECPVDA